MILILVQFLLLCATSAGWGFLLKRFLKIDSPWSLSLATLLFGAGFACQILLLQNLVYFNLPVQSVFAIPAAIGCFGLFLLSKKPPAISKPDLFRAAGILLAIFLLQASTAFIESPNFFYGKGHTDQYNYTVLSQFLQTQPFGSTAANIHLHPWLTRTYEFKEWRIGQAVAQAYTACLSFSNSKEAYPGISAFCLALLALVTYSLARALAIPRDLAAIAGVWTGLAPALTRYHLEGFLSQTVTIFVLPFLVLWARCTTRQPGFAIGIPAIVLSYLLVAYVELLPIGLVVFGGLSLFLIYSNGVRSVVTAIGAVALSLVLVPYALRSSYTFLVEQLERAGQRHNSLEAQAGLAGTVPGWIQGLIHVPFLTYPLQFLTALALIALAGVAIYFASRRNQIFLTAALAPPILVLGYLLTRTPFAKYPFAKVQDSFAYLWILIPLVGLARLRPVAPAQIVILVGPAILAILAALGTYHHHKPILNHTGILQSLQSPGVISAIKYAEAHPGQTYLVKTSDRYVAAWLAYHARNSNAYLTPPRMADFSLNQSAYEFTKIPNHVPGMVLLSNRGVGSQGMSGGVPTMDIFNPQGEEHDAKDVWYWLSDHIEIEINRWDDNPRPVQYKLNMRLEPGPSNPSPYRKLRLTNTRTGLSEIIEAAAGKIAVVPIILLPGYNPFLLELLEPTIATVTLAHDPRRLMVRIINPSLGDPKPIDKSDLALVQTLTGKIPPAPTIKGVNVQGEDMASGSSWFWVAKDMEFQFQRTDDTSTNQIYQLTFRAEAGFANPNPERTIRLTHLETGTETILKLAGAATLSATLNLKPGTNTVKLAIVGDLPQIVKAPGDLRIHMLRVEEFRLRYLRPAAEDLPKGKTKR